METSAKKSLSYKFEPCRNGEHEHCRGAQIVRKSDDMGDYDLPTKCNCHCHQPTLFKLVERTQRDLF